MTAVQGRQGRRGWAACSASRSCLVIGARSRSLRLSAHASCAAPNRLQTLCDALLSSPKHASCAHNNFSTARLHLRAPPATRPPHAIMPTAGVHHRCSAGSPWALRPPPFSRYAGAAGLCAPPAAGPGGTEPRCAAVCSRDRRDVKLSGESDRGQALCALWALPSTPCPRAVLTAASSRRIPDIPCMSFCALSLHLHRLVRCHGPHGQEDGEGQSTTRLLSKRRAGSTTLRSAKLLCKLPVRVV